MNTAATLIGIAGIVITTVGALAGWINHGLERLRAGMAQLGTEVAVLRTQLAPVGGPSLDNRVHQLEQDVAVLKEKTR